MADPVPIGSNLLVDPTTMGVTAGNRLGVKSAFPRVISATTGTLQAGDNGNGVQCTNGSAVTLNVPAGLGPFQCFIVQAGAGAVTPTGVGTTINQRQSHTATAGQYAVISLIATAPDVFTMGGDTA